MDVSLIISVYKNVADLKVVLDGLSFQTYRNYEIVISEDGMDDAMKSFIANYESTNPVVHVSQSDIGWRKNAALNSAIRKSRGEYLIFIDGDCVLHHRFIEAHVKFASENRILAGKRVKLGARYSGIFRANIHQLPTLQRRLERESFRILKDGAQFYEEAIYINPDGVLGFIPRLRRMNQLKGCNMSFFRDSIELINGFDEDYKFPAIGEDIDLTWRFKGLGFELFSVRNIAVQYHLHHKENWTEQVENQRIMYSKKAARQFVCQNGLKKLRPKRILETMYYFSEENDTV
jgi:glycosyltransferase involved in cell wall biosynthesis